MVLNSFLNNILVKIFLKTNAIIIKGKSKIRIKNGAEVIANEKSSLLIGYGDSATATFKSTGTNIELLDNSKLIINGKSCIGYNSCIRLEKNSILEIGNNTYIAAKALIRTAKKIKIGNNCAISWNVTILDSDFHNFEIDNKDVVTVSEVIIEDNVWIGNNVIILKGVKVGNNSIIGAGSVVTKNVEPFTAVAGNPAKKIKDNVNPINVHNIENR